MSDFPYLKHIGGGRFAYVMRLTFGRGRINVGRVEDPLIVRDGY